MRSDDDKINYSLEYVKQICLFLTEKWLNNFVKEGNVVQINSHDNTIIEFPFDNPNKCKIMGKVEINGFDNNEIAGKIVIFELIKIYSKNSFIEIGEMQVKKLASGNINIEINLSDKHKHN